VTCLEDEEQFATARQLEDGSVEFSFTVTVQENVTSFLVDEFVVEFVGTLDELRENARKEQDDEDKFRRNPTSPFSFADKREVFTFTCRDVMDFLDLDDRDELLERNVTNLFREFNDKQRQSQLECVVPLLQMSMPVFLVTDLLNLAARGVNQFEQKDTDKVLRSVMRVLALR